MRKLSLNFILTGFRTLLAINSQKKDKFKRQEHRTFIDWFIAVPAKITRSGHQTELKIAACPALLRGTPIKINNLVSKLRCIAFVLLPGLKPAQKNQFGY